MSKISLPRKVNAEKKACREPLQIDGVDPRREKKLTAGTVRNVLPCTFLTYEICIEQISLLRGTTAVRGGTDTLRTLFCRTTTQMCCIFSTDAFAKRWYRYKEAAENKAQAYFLYAEHLFSACDAVDVPYICKGRIFQKIYL